MKRLIHRIAVGGVAAALSIGAGLAFTPNVEAQEASGPYWFDDLSKCVDPCSGLDMENCMCFRLPPSSSPDSGGLVP